MPVEKMHVHSRNLFIYLESEGCKKRAKYKIRAKKINMTEISMGYRYQKFSEHRAN